MLLLYKGLISRHAMVTDVQAEVPGHAEEVFETPEYASKKIAPLYNGRS
jgi:hypothetical protein